MFLHLYSFCFSWELDSVTVSSLMHFYFCWCPVWDSELMSKYQAAAQQISIHLQEYLNFIGFSFHKIHTWRSKQTSRMLIVK